MPVADPSSGRFFIWIVSGFLFVCVTVGGTFLVMYLILPPTPATEWLPIVGVSLVCLPWGFWFFTCIYRVVSRAFGFRMVIGGGGGDNESEDANNNGKGGPGSPSGDTRSEGDSGHKNGENGGMKRTSSSANSLPIASKESEMPLTSTMGSQ
ncbi:hypothetical protein LINGRAHAP2_LOCUS12143 [Linum grandiflorum]